MAVDEWIRKLAEENIKYHRKQIRNLSDIVYHGVDNRWGNALNTEIYQIKTDYKLSMEEICDHLEYVAKGWRKK